nr:HYPOTHETICAL 27.7 KD PROTEIN IN CPT1-SPC98 INTERGENIC REGION [Schizosaccharomyces pombe]
MTRKTIIVGVRENKNVAPEALIEYADIIKEFKAPAIPTLEQHLVFVDGFMMYVNEDLINAFDIRLMLVTDFDTLKRRREARTGYITLEGFWQDPPHYFENYVWPGYVHGHSHLFVNGDVTGKLLDKRIQLSPSSKMSVRDNVQWAINSILNALQ